MLVLDYMHGGERKRLAVHIEYVREHRFDDDSFHRRDTIVRLHGVQENGEPNKADLLGTGDAVLHPLDRFSAVHGRKLAFARAMDDAGIDDRLERGALWAAFLGRVRQ